MNRTIHSSPANKNLPLNRRHCRTSRVCSPTGRLRGQAWPDVQHQADGQGAIQRVLGNPNGRAAQVIWRGKEECDPPDAPELSAFHEQLLDGETTPRGEQVARRLLHWLFDTLVRNLEGGDEEAITVAVAS